GPNEDKPINCLTWFEATLFCIWDGGRLPTDAEWSYAATGKEGRILYPFGEAVDHSLAVYGCGVSEDGASCGSDLIFPVGSRSPGGDGYWNHSDLAGNV